MLNHWSQTNLCIHQCRIDALVDTDTIPFFFRFAPEHISSNSVSYAHAFKYKDCIKLM